jgi:signal transduction histidine kinase
LLAGLIALQVALSIALGVIVAASDPSPIPTPTALGLAAVSILGAGVAWSALRRLSRLAARSEELDRTAAELTARIERDVENRRSLEAILSSMEEGVVLLKPDGGVAFVNPAAHRLLGGVPPTLARLTPARLRETVTRARDGPAEDEIEIGTRVRVRASAMPLPDDGRVLLVLRDVTDARRVEAMRRDFAANASHELKTPVASIQADAETMRRALTDDPAAADRFAQRLEEDAARLARLVSDLLDLSRLEVEEPPSSEPVRLDRVAEEEVARLRRPAEESGVDLVVDAAPATVIGSQRELALLVRNLLDNAVRYTPSGGKVEVGVSGDHGQAVLSVRDTGMGIPTRDLPRIFERFYRVDPARSRETGGTGLGLSIARHVAEQHGARIEATSELGRGSTFTVRFPAGG